MKAYIVVSGTLFGLFAAMHFYIAWDHWRGPTTDFWTGFWPALVGIGAGVLAAWAFRLARSRSGAAA